MSRFELLRSAPGVTTIVFDDGGMNLLSSAALRELQSAVDSVSDARLLLFRSGRDGIFAAGADMAEMSRFGAAEALDFSRLGQETFALIEHLPMLTAALVDGDCFGGALDLILAFDFRFATQRARFAHPGAKLGIVTGFGGTSRWRKVMSPASARRVFLGNETLSLVDALAAGIVDGVGLPDVEKLMRLDTAAVKAVTRLY